MNFKTLSLVAASLAILGCQTRQEPFELVKSADDTRSNQEFLFDEGNYAMFIHFGLYSKFESEWKGKAYYGNAEWIMNHDVADIPVDEYMAEAATFNPSEFDADAVAQLAKDAGMKYIVITSKHHEGFAMYDSDVSDFTITKATPLKRDVIGELVEACHRKGLGIGFYYSQFQDWTEPGGGVGPTTDKDGNPVSFDEYFYKKCVPQVEEITTKYGDLELIWFDTPGTMPSKYSKELVELVRKNQPHALVSSRVGNGMGDYRTMNDMELPVKNIEGRWEGIDVTQVGWGFSKFDNEWKTPEYILHTLLSTIARGGTFMLNVGPTSKGVIAEQAQKSLLKAGEWIRKYPQTVYGAGPSPWDHAMPWGDAVTQGDKLYLLVYDWPKDGKLHLPGLGDKVSSARIVGGKKLGISRNDGWTDIAVPFEEPEEMVSVIELSMKEMSADPTFGVAAGNSTVIPVAFAETKGCEAYKKGWTKRFGEWNAKWTTRNISKDSEIAWTFDLEEPGYYNFEISYTGKGMSEWTLSSDEGRTIQDKQPSYDQFEMHRLGWMKFDSAGKHTVTLKAIDADYENLSVSDLKIEKVSL